MGGKSAVPKIVVDTDLFVDHLTSDRSPSLLRIALRKFFCYTTVFQAIELFALARSSEERQAVEDSMAAVKILGLNARNAPMYGELLAAHRRRATMHVLAAGLCREARLPLLTGRTKEFRGLGVILVSRRLVRQYETGEEILSVAARAGRPDR